ncbi:tRNA (N6-threonylcarbamoyladenosine(37)-N6)-methyltransferase TrmO [Salinisphaera sp. Q1T1-3]|nr:tRNA (N6-threonylcarbamoyladenosine(37)-N6)-methyltransferase TrmO [Salinisphaera sp. Q1T1-3]
MSPENPSTETRDAGLQVIGIAASDYPDKFGVPRQPGLVPAARGVVSLVAPFDDPAAIEGLAAYTHIWLSFVFDRSPTRWRARVRPPRLGGNRRVGVFATRSTHRPNRLGLSCVTLHDIATTATPARPPWSLPGLSALQPARTHLLIGGHDLVAGTPIVDIKPYLPWVDAVPQAEATMAPEPPRSLAVHWTPEAERLLAGQVDPNGLHALVTQVCAQDPRPAYRRDAGARVYGMALRDVDVRFAVDDTRATVTVRGIYPPM